MWKKIQDPNANLDEIIENLKSIKYNLLSGRTQQLLNLSKDQWDGFIKRYAGTVPVKTSPINCMATLRKTNSDKFAISCPILATENGVVYILNPQTFQILHQVSV